MYRLLNNARKTHRLFLAHYLYPLALSSALAVGVLLVRVYISRLPTFWFLVWNLWLAWIPYLCALGVVFFHRRDRRAWWMLVLPGCAWLIFLPNAPYIITDLWHLDARPRVPMWYDIGMLATFAWTGWFLGLASLRMMQEIVETFVGRIVGWSFVLATLGLSGLGIYLGRFLKWNSWDLLFRPQSVVADIVTRLAHPFQYPQAFGVTLLFAAFLLVTYLTFVSVEQRKTERLWNE